MGDITPVVAAVIGFAVAAASGFIAVPYLRKLHFGQTILEIGPKWHSSKQGTPTMGGVMIVVGTVIALAASLCFSLIAHEGFADEAKSAFEVTQLFAALGLALFNGLIGFADDYIKVVKKRNLGLTARQKTFLQLLVAAGYLATLALCGMDTTWLPFLGSVSITSGFGLIFWPIALFFIYGFVNAVNLTDGLDGLASSVTMIVLCVFMLISGLTGHSGVNALAASGAGACLGFLMWNAHPAKVFMGDTGSLFLGGLVVGVSFASGRPILLILAGIVYLCEAFSVILQVSYYKKTKKRLFKMSPIHHHFELCGYSEERIVFLFSAVAVIFGIIAIIPELF